MLNRLKRAAAIVRPRNIARMAARLEKIDGRGSELGQQVQELRRGTNRALAEIQQEVGTLRRCYERDVAAQLGDIAASVAAMQRTLTAVHGTVQALQLRTEQLTVIQRAEATDTRRLARLPTLLETARIRAHATKAIADSELHSEPFPYMVIDDVLPADFYDALLDAIPPRILFEDRPINKQQLKVPPRFAPTYSRKVWRFFVSEIVERQMSASLLARFRQPLTDYLQRYWPGLSIDDPALSLGASEGRIILRRAGYVIPPHRDPRWGFITFILYLARPGDPDTWGTQVYRVRGDAEAPTAQPHWIDGSRCDLVGNVPFTPNRALVFLNSCGAHAASIPADAPADFERYIYQWRIGPDGQAVRRLKARLTPEARALWEGKEGY